MKFASIRRGGESASWIRRRRVGFVDSKEGSRLRGFEGGESASWIRRRGVGFVDSKKGSRHRGFKAMDSKEMDSKKTDSREMDSKKMDSRGMDSKGVGSMYRFEPGRTHEALNLNRSYLPNR